MCNSILLTDPNHVDRLEDMAAMKNAVAQERERKKLEKEATRQQRANEKRKKMEEKKARAEVAKSKRRHKELWSVKNVKALGDKLHDAIRANAPVLGYKAPYCGFHLQICKDNMRVAIARRQAKKRGEDVNSLPALQEVQSPLPCSQFRNLLSQHSSGASQSTVFNTVPWNYRSTF